MRYITGDAGHVERLVNSVKIVIEFPDMALLQREVLKERKIEVKKVRTKKHPGKFFAARSYEPHQALARELGIMERAERWRLTIAVGVPLLRLWEEGRMKAVRFLLLAQLIRYDRWMLIPFLSEYLKHEKKPKEIVVDVWKKMWKTFPSAMELAEPQIPRSLLREDGSIKRTADHHVLFRRRFLQWDEGLNLNDEQLGRIVECFNNYKAPKFPSDYYSKIGFIMTGKYPSRREMQTMKKEIYSAFKLFSRLSYSSAAAVFHYIHGKILPGSYMDWDEYLHYLRSGGHFSLHSTSNPDDVLFTIKGER